MYKIIGTDKFHNKETYWDGDSLKDCLKYLDDLKRSTTLITIRFKWIEY